MKRAEAGGSITSKVRKIVVTIGGVPILRAARRKIRS